MSTLLVPGKRPVFSASAALEAVGTALLAIKSEDRLTYADLGAVLGKSEDQAAKYCDGTATMDFITFGRGKREFNGRFTGAFDRLCVESRPGSGDDRTKGSAILKAALALSVALESKGEIDPSAVRANRKTLESARDAIDEVLGKLAPQGVRA